MYQHALTAQEIDADITPFFRTPDIQAEAIFTLREVLPEDLNVAEDKLYKASKFTTVVSHEQVGLFDYYIVLSGNRPYEVVRFQHFAKCECKDFEYSQTACKHIAVCMPKVCRVCFDTPVETRGKVCPACVRHLARERIAAMPYIKTDSGRKAELVGSVRI